MADFTTTARPLQNLNINLDEQDKRAVAGAFNSESFSGKSPVIADYESVIAHYFSAPYSLACCNGTVAIELALRGLSIEPGARVALPPTAPIMTILPIISLGCEPVFYDVSPTSFAPDLDDLHELLPEGIDALITVPMWGYSWDMQPIVRFCKAHNIRLIEDCAHAIGTEMDGHKFGTFGDAAAFSTHERKLVSTGEGGFCLTPHKEVADRMRTWQHHGAEIDETGAFRLGRHIGSNCKLPPLCAALGISQFAKLDIKIRARRRIASRLRKQLQPCVGLREFQRYPGSEINGYAMVFWYRGAEGARIRADEMASRGIHSDTVRYDYKPLYQEPAFADFARHCPNAERMIRSIVTLPCHEGLNTDDVRDIAAITEEVFAVEEAVEKAS